MASWLASQLQKAENLLEAVDRTVSSASTQQFKGLGSGAQRLSSSDGNSSYNRLTSGPFGGSTNAQKAPDSPGYGTPSNASLLQPHAATASSSPRPFPALTPGADRSKQQEPPGQGDASDTSQLRSSVTVPGQGSAAGSAGQAQPAAPPAPQPTSTSSFTVRAHGPFSPSPVQELGPQPQGSQQRLTRAVPQRQGPLQQQQSLHAPPAPTAFGSWGPPPPLAKTSKAPAAGPAVPAALTLSAGTESHNGLAIPHTLPAPAPSLQNSAIAPLQSMTSAAVEPAAPAETVFGGTAPKSSNEQLASQHEQVLSSTGESPPTSNGIAGPVVAAEDAPDTTAAAASELPAAVSRSNGNSSQEIRSQQAAQSAPAADAVAAALRAALQEQQQQQQDYIPAPDGSTSTQQLNSLEGTSAAAAAATPGSTSNPGAAVAGSDPQLMRLVDTLRKRLDQVKAENQQLEDLLHNAEQATAAEQQRAQQLAAELASMHRAQDDIVSSAAANAAAQDAKIARLQQDLEASTRQVAALQGALEAIQEQHQQVLSSKDSIEGGALEALRSELASAESQLEFERRAHAVTKTAATSRERDLEEQLASGSAALAFTQRQMDDLAARGRELEEQQAVAVAEASRLREQVRNLSQQQTAVQQPDSGQQFQLEAEKEALTVRLSEAQAAVLAATHAQRAAEAEAAALQQEIAHIHSNYQASAAAARSPPQLEQQLAELQELLYQKQQQLERLSGEKQGQMLLLERQVQMLKSELGKAHAAAAAAQVSTTTRGGHDIIPMDALGEPYQRLARHRKLGGAVQATANFLDRTAASAAQLLRQQPLARLIVFLYIILIHLYVYFLLARMQRQAVTMLAAQDKATAGHEVAHQLPGTH